MKDDNHSIEIHEEEDPLEGYFQPGFIPEDHPGVHSLLRANKELEAFRSLFSGSVSSITIRLLILREIGSRADEPHWSPRDISHIFSFIDETKLNTALLRLRSAKILQWLPDISRYQLSPMGRMAIASLGTLMQFSRDEGSELGYLTSQIAASQALGDVNQEALEHLLARLTELEDEFERAIVSGSETRIRASESKLNSVWIHIEQGLEIMESIHDRIDVDMAAYRIAQQIGQRQSRMLNMAGRFQSELNLIERNKVHIERGLSSSDILFWLQMQTVSDLVKLSGGATTFCPEPGFVLSDIALDVAEDILLDRSVEEQNDSLPPPAESTEININPLTEISYESLHQFTSELEGLCEEKEFQEAVLHKDFGNSSYRMSLLTILGLETDIDQNNPIHKLINLPVSVEPDAKQTRITLDKAGVCEMTTGQIRPQEK